MNLSVNNVGEGVGQIAREFRRGQAIFVLGILKEMNSEQTCLRYLLKLVTSCSRQFGDRFFALFSWIGEESSSWLKTLKRWLPFQIQAGGRWWCTNLQQLQQPLGQVVDDIEAAKVIANLILRAAIIFNDDCLLSPLEQSVPQQDVLPEALQLATEEAISTARDAEPSVAQSMHLQNADRAQRPDDDTVVTTHRLTHLPHARWCKECVAAKTIEDVCHQIPKDMDEVPTVELDYIFLSDSEETESGIPVLIAVSKATGHVFANAVLTKGRSDSRAIHLLTQFLCECGLTGRVRLRSRDESALIAVMQAVTRLRAPAETIVERVPPDSASFGDVVDCYSRTVQADAYLWKMVVEEKWKTRVTTDSAILPWICCAYSLVEKQIPRLQQ